MKFTLVWAKKVAGLKFAQFQADASLDGMKNIGISAGRRVERAMHTVAALCSVFCCWKY